VGDLWSSGEPSRPVRIRQRDPTHDGIPAADPAAIFSVRATSGSAGATSARAPVM
ncbi:uncharacterized protein METZ01_LOCUS340849, partial [marine metagenome]